MTTEPLPRGQQVMLQRLMAEHTMTDEKADQLLQKLIAANVDVGGSNVSNTTECFASINQQLKRGFGLEMMTMISNNNNNNDNDDNSNDGNNNNNSKGQKIHAVVNTDLDDVAKESFGSIVGYHERTYLRCILEALATEGPSVRSTLVNLRTENETVKMDLDTADRFIETLLDQHWLAWGDDETSETTTTTRRRRESMNAKIILGPRAYMELHRSLTDMGYPEEDMPQFIFHQM